MEDIPKENIDTTTTTDKNIFIKLNNNESFIIDIKTEDHFNKSKYVSLYLIKENIKRIELNEFIKKPKKTTTITNFFSTGTTKYEITKTVNISPHLINQDKINNPVTTEEELPHILNYTEKDLNYYIKQKLQSTDDDKKFFDDIDNIKTINDFDYDKLLVSQTDSSKKIKTIEVNKVSKGYYIVHNIYILKNINNNNYLYKCGYYINNDNKEYMITSITEFYSTMNNEIKEINGKIKNYMENQLDHANNNLNSVNPFFNRSNGEAWSPINVTYGGGKSKTHRKPKNRKPKNKKRKTNKYKKI